MQNRRTVVLSLPLSLQFSFSSSDCLTAGGSRRGWSVLLRPAPRASQIRNGVLRAAWRLLGKLHNGNRSRWTTTTHVLSCRATITGNMSRTTCDIWFGWWTEYLQGWWTPPWQCCAPCASETAHRCDRVKPKYYACCWVEMFLGGPTSTTLCMCAHCAHWWRSAAL